jgi:hypothetical protein
MSVPQSKNIHTKESKSPRFQCQRGKNPNSLLTPLICTYYTAGSILMLSNLIPTTSQTLLNADKNLSDTGLYNLHDGGVITFGRSSTPYQMAARKFFVI